MEPKHVISFDSMGVPWRVLIWDNLSSDDAASLEQTCIDRCASFEQLYSRFKEDSLVSEIATQGAGQYDVPEDLVRMLRLYEDLYLCSNGLFTPLIGYTLEDLGYDANYSLSPREFIRSTPSLPDVLTITSDTSITLSESVLIDIGALGKGFMVDLLFEALRSLGLSHFLVDGSGDIRYTGPEPVSAGLEDPDDPNAVIGTYSLSSGALAASGVNRRVWRGTAHIIRPDAVSAPSPIYASWVHAETAVLADALATALFLAPPSAFLDHYSFSYCLLNRERRIKKSADFAADFFQE